MVAESDDYSSFASDKMSEYHDNACAAYGDTSCTDTEEATNY